MDTVSRPYELPHDLHFNKYAQQILENSKTATTVATASLSTPTITSLDAGSSSNFLQILGASLINSIQLQHSIQNNPNTTTTTTTTKQMDLEFAPNHVVIDSSFNAMDELQKQLEYDKFMNEVWIGIVLTLILISMIFCICSCFLYHQFRTWKSNYYNTVAQVQDIESVKCQTDIDDPVPQYTLVSGLPSYEAALDLIKKTPKSCLLVYPSIYQVFNQHERHNAETTTTMTAITTAAATATQTATTTATPTTTPSETSQVISEVTTPLLSATNQISNCANRKNFLSLPSYEDVNNFTIVTLSIDEKSLQTTTIQSVAATTAPELTAKLSMTETPTTSTNVNFNEQKSDEENSTRQE